jgi:hypothetical protein
MRDLFENLDPVDPLLARSARQDLYTTLEPRSTEDL